MFSHLGSASSSDVVAHFGGKGNGLDGSKLPARSSSRAAHWTALIIQTCWLILEVDLNIWISCIVCMCEQLSFPPEGICWVTSAGNPKHIEHISLVKDFRHYIAIKF